ncbi:hydroquinone glucosyltransferase-like [Curcuma longa]|uniref:hydroquinone glucosyltransferase-like n=1 Tax=Curcuma longa TaxID=136217 RepID=UPI003D9E2F5B
MAMAEGDGETAPHVALLSSPGSGHLIPLAKLAELLVHRHGFTVTFILFADHAQSACLRSFPASSFSSVQLPPVPLDDLPSDAQVETRLAAMVERSAPGVHDVLRRLKTTTHLVAYVIDIFGTATLPAAKQLGVPRFLFCTTNFFALSFLFHLPELDRTTSCEYRDLPEPVAFPGCLPLRGEDFLQPIQDRTDDAYRCVLDICRGIREVDSILVNSFVELEPAACEALKSERPPAIPVGPVVTRNRREDTAKGDHSYLQWLDYQPRGSVLFVSFGSGGTLSTEQMRELAFGLEQSGQRFVWVVRCPNDRETSGAFFQLSGLGADDPLAYLPEGFLARTRGTGVVVPLWVLQVELLAHPATGGFLSHCGWNSTLESVAHGVPMIAWPLYAEQRVNAVLLSEGAGVALRPKKRTGLVGRETVAEVVKELFEGEEGKRVREKVQQLKEAAARAAESEDGSSYKALADVVKKWKNGTDTVVDA